MRKNGWLSVIIVVLLGMTLARPGLAMELNEFQIKARAAVLMDPQSGRVLFDQNAHQQLPPASVTKLMTMLLIMEAVDQGKIKWTDQIPTSAIAAGMGGSQVFLKEHEELPLKEMLKAIAVVSANDASTAVAEYLYGTDEDFILAMNRRARQLGLKNTHFANETGLPDPNHYSSAYDLAVISRELLKHPAILKFTSIWMDSLRGGKFILKNTNNLIRYYPGADGLKTGHTDQALFCLSATAVRDKFRLLAVVLGASSNAERMAQTRRLLDYGFRNYEKRLILPSGAVAGKMRLAKASPAEVEVKTHSRLETLTERGNSTPFKTRLEVSPNLKLPLAEGANVGNVKAYQGKELVGQTPVYTVKKVKKANFIVLGWRALLTFFQNLFHKGGKA